MASAPRANAGETGTHPFGGDCGPTDEIGERESHRSGATRVAHRHPTSGARPSDPSERPNRYAGCWSVPLRCRSKAATHARG